jgi:hypothetical protein
MPLQNREDFFSQLRDAFNINQLQRLVLSKYRGEEPDLERATLRPVHIKQEAMLSLLYQYKTHHLTKNLHLDDVINR